MKKTFSYWDTLFAEPPNNIYINAKRRFTRSYWYYALILFVIIPFYLIDWVSPLNLSFFDQFTSTYLPIYSMSAFHTNWGLMFDVYLQILGLFALFLLSNILWIMFNITWTLRDWGGVTRKFSPNSCVFNTKIRIISIRNAILKILLYYFSCVSLAIVSYLNPTIFFSKETALLLVLLLIGFSFFFFGLDAIQQTLKNQVEYELEGINKITQEHIQKLKVITSRDIHMDNNEITYISNILDTFHKQRAQLEQINTNLYDAYSIVRFISALLLPIMTGMFKGAIGNSIINSAIINQELGSMINETVTIITSKI